MDIIPIMHVTHILPRDVAGHWSWECSGCLMEASGYELAAEVIAAAEAHGPRAAVSLVPIDDEVDPQQEGGLNLDVRAMLATLAAETGWSENSQALALIDFVGELTRDDPVLLERLRAFLAHRARAEGVEAVDLLAGERLPWNGRRPGS